MHSSRAAYGAVTGAASVGSALTEVASVGAVSANAVSRDSVLMGAVSVGGASAGGGAVSGASGGAISADGDSATAVPGAPRCSNDSQPVTSAYCTVAYPLITWPVCSTVLPAGAVAMNPYSGPGPARMGASTATLAGPTGRASAVGIGTVRVYARVSGRRSRSGSAAVSAVDRSRRGPPRGPSRPCRPRAGRRPCPRQRQVQRVFLQLQALAAHPTGDGSPP